MPSSIAWLDYSDAQRRRILDVVRSLGEKDTRDELGLATVRDALADLLAPGVSTIQSRARYFLFVPWIYQRIEERVGRKSGGVAKDWVARKARNAEAALIEHLLEADDSAGVIGSWAGKALQRLPSSIYWNGLGQWRIRLCPWSIDAYHHRLAVHGPPSTRDEGHARGGWANWHPGLPPAPAGFPAGAEMRLRPAEAEYLRDRILETHPESLLGQLVLGGADVSDLDQPWNIIDLGIDLPPRVSAVVRHAREFSLAMHGAVLLYNLMLAEAAGERADWTDRYRDRFADWAREVDARGREFAAWDRAEFWRTVEGAGRKVPLNSRRFIDAWLDRLLGTDDPRTLADDPAVRNLIDNRERQLKKGQARLHHPRLLELWNGDTGSGIARMNFRWPVMRSHLADIQAGLNEAVEARIARAQ